MSQQALFDTHKLSPSQQECYEALRHLIVASTTADVQKLLSERYGIPRDRSCIARRLLDLEEHGLVERVGKDFSRKGQPTTWRRK